MDSSRRAQRFRDLVLSAQHPVNAPLYAEKFGKFLNQGCKSKIRVLYSSLTIQLSASSATYRSEDASLPTLIGSSTSDSSDQPASDIEAESSATNQDSRNLQDNIYEGNVQILETSQAVRAICSDHVKGLLVFEVGQAHSFARIDMTEQVFDQLTKSLNLFGAVKDAVLYIGFRGMEIEVAPPRPRINFIVDEGDARVKGSEIVYGLRYIALNGKSPGKPWSLRQFTVYNKTVYNSETSNWLLISIPPVLRDQLSAYLESNGEGIECNPFELHALIISTTLPMWRPYLIDLTESAEQVRLQICMADSDGQGAFKLRGDTLHVLKNLEDDVLDMVLAITATIDTIKTLQKLYSAVWYLETRLVRDTHANEPDTVATVLHETLKDAEQLAEQAQMLVTKLRSSSRLARSFLDLANGHALKNLTMEAREENATMAQLTQTANRDAKAVKALGVVTVIFLPITVVLNFFSASFIDVSDGAMHLVSHWWLFVVVGIPLTILTLASWLIWISQTTASESNSRFRNFLRFHISAKPSEADDPEKDPGS